MSLELANFRRVAGGIDPARALAELEYRPELWDLLTVRQNYQGSAHRDTRMIALRGPTTLEDVFNNLEAVDYQTQEHLPATLELIVRVMQLLRTAELGRIMLVKLRAGGHVTPHVDEGRYAERYARFHLVLSSSPKCWFRAGLEKVWMAPGELWWFNHRITHEVRNDGTDRIHLIIDAIAPGYAVGKVAV